MEQPDTLANNTEPHKRFIRRLTPIKDFFAAKNLRSSA
jgi:hypothetical protein